MLERLKGSCRTSLQLAPISLALVGALAFAQPDPGAPIAVGEGGAAQEPPPPDELLLRSREALAQIPGCHVVEAQIHREMRLGPFRDEEAYTLFGEVDEGRWRGFSWVTERDQKEGFQAFFLYDETRYPFGLPSIGALPGGRAEGFMEGQSFLAMALEGGADRSESLVVLGETFQGSPVWALERLLMVEHPVKGRTRPVTLQVLFDRETLRPIRWSGGLKRGLPLEPERGAIQVHDFTFSIEVDEANLPVAESWSGKFRFGMGNLKMNQEVSYSRVGGC